MCPGITFVVNNLLHVLKFKHTPHHQMLLTLLSCFSGKVFFIVQIKNPNVLLQTYFMLHFTVSDQFNWKTKVFMASIV